MSTTVISVLVMFAAQLLPAVGIEVGTEDLTQTITTLATIGAGLWIWYQRISRGDVTTMGIRK